MIEDAVIKAMVAGVISGLFSGGVVLMVSVITFRVEIKWLKELILELKANCRRAHERIDDINIRGKT